ncbi:MAG: hypothetical protein ACREX3_10005 [Gammaproteobacteria bacterium]
MESVMDRLSRIDEQINQAYTAVEHDDGATPALKIVVEALHDKSANVLNTLLGAGDRTIRERIIELEQVANSAKRAAQIDLGISGGTCHAVVDAHDAVGALRHSLSQP